MSSGKNVYNALNKNHHNVDFIDLNKNNINKILSFKPDIIFNALHGEFGEDGGLTCFAEKYKIRITHSNQIASSLCLNKELTKFFLKKNLNINTPKTYSKLNNIKYPVIIKPNKGGSSFGIYVADNDIQLKSILKKSTEDMIVEQKIIANKELTVTVIEEKGNVRSLGVTEINFQSDIYDYQAKYTKGFSNHIFPAKIPKEDYAYLLKISENIFKIIGCKSIARIDYIMDKNKNLNRYFFLEINTHPGLTDISLAPEQASFNNLSYTNLVEMILSSA